jgi:hypothetical protein
MSEHYCIHETDMAVMSERQKQMQDEQGEQGADIKAILEILKGNGKPGICTDVALLKQKQNWMWAGIGASSTGVFGIFCWIVKGIISIGG